MSGFKPRRRRPVNQLRAEDVRALMQELQAAGVIQTLTGEPLPDDLETPLPLLVVNEKHPSAADPSIRKFLNGLRRVSTPIEAAI